MLSISCTGYAAGGDSRIRLRHFAVARAPTIHDPPIDSYESAHVLTAANQCWRLLRLAVLSIHSTRSGSVAAPTIAQSCCRFAIARGLIVGGQLDCTVCRHRWHTHTSASAWMLHLKNDFCSRLHAGRDSLLIAWSTTSPTRGCLSSFPALELS